MLCAFVVAVVVVVVDAVFILPPAFNIFTHSFRLETKSQTTIKTQNRKGKPKHDNSNKNDI